MVASGSGNRSKSALYFGNNGEVGKVIGGSKVEVGTNTVIYYLANSTRYHSRVIICPFDPRLNS